MKIWKWDTRLQEAPLFGSIHKSNPHQEGLGRYGRFCKPYSVEHFTSGRNFRKKNPRIPNGSNRFRRKRRVHHGPHPAVVESRPHSFFSSFPCGKNRSILSCASGKTLVAQTPIGSIHLSPVCERKTEWQDDTYSRKPLAIRAGRGSPSGNHVLRPMSFIWGKLSIKATRYLHI